MGISTGEWVIIGVLVGPASLIVGWGIFRILVLGTIGAIVTRVEDFLVRKAAQ